MDPWTLAELIEDFSDDPDDLLVKIRLDDRHVDFKVDYAEVDGKDTVVLIPEPVS